MAYSKTTWKDRDVQFPNRFIKTENGDGTITLAMSTGSVTEEGTPVNAANLNNIEDGIVSVTDATFFKEVGGNGNAITINISTPIIDGLPINFICKFDNNGNTTTLNGIPIKRPITLTTPILVVGQLVSVVYNNANSCFFYKASAEGNADPSKVLAGRTFSNFNQTGLVGTMVNNGRIDDHISNAEGVVNIPSGFIDGGIITAPSLSEVTQDATIDNANQLLINRKAYGKNGTLYTGTYRPYTPIVGTAPVTFHIITHNGRRTHTSRLNISGLPSEPKFVFVHYDGYGVYLQDRDSNHPNGNGNYFSSMLSYIFDKNRLLMPYMQSYSNDNSYIQGSVLVRGKSDDSFNVVKGNMLSEGDDFNLYQYSNGTLTVRLSEGDALVGQNIPYIAFC